jgi:hypothetical protein
MDILATIALTLAIATGPEGTIVHDREPGEPMCRANGQWYSQGEIACIQPPCMEPRLSRCGMVLNNSAWEKIEDGCPIGSAPQSEHTQLAAQSAESLPGAQHCER